MTEHRKARGSVVARKHTLGEQLHLSNAPALRQEVIPVTNSDRNHRKPRVGTGLWTSTWLGAEQTSAWATHEQAKGRYSFLLTPTADARIATIDNLADLKRLLKGYRRKAFGQYSYLEEFDYLDYAHMSQDFDALHLTVQGQRKTRLTIPDLYGWDVESTLWFRWCFAHVQRIDALTVR